MNNTRRTNSLSSISLIIPTYKEANNLKQLINKIRDVKNNFKLDLELWIMDDNSKDGTENVINDINENWINLVIRTKDRGLSQSVIDGLNRARNEIFVVMDADLSHPPEKIPELVEEIQKGADFVIGSRYIQGGSTDSSWSFFRWLNSKVATLFARPFTSAKDPMSGFFAIHKNTYKKGSNSLNAIGYKIGLELIVKCNCKNIMEIPIFFKDREIGESKLTLKEQLRYITHIRRLFLFKYPNLSYIIQFAVVGTSGLLVNLFTVQIAHLLGLIDQLSIALGIAISVFTNFLLNRRFTFSYAKKGPFWNQLIGFIGASSIGMLVNYFVTLTIRIQLQLPLLLAVCCGVLAGMSFNYIINRFMVFRKPVK